MNTFTPKVFGVKRNGTFWAIEIANMFGDINKYDFLLQDSLVESYNGNNRYRLDVIEGKKACIGNWNLNCIDFPGDWFGQYGRFVIEDKEGVQFCSTTCVKGWYSSSRETMIRKCLTEASRFIEQYDSVAFYNICTGLELPTTIAKVEDLDEMQCKLSLYIKQFSSAYTAALSQNDISKAETLKSSLLHAFEEIKKIKISL